MFSLDFSTQILILFFVDDSLLFSSESIKHEPYPIPGPSPEPWSGWQNWDPMDWIDPSMTDRINPTRPHEDGGGHGWRWSSMTGMAVLF